MDWEEKLSQEEQDKWSSLLEEMIALKNQVDLERCLSTQDAEKKTHAYAVC